MAYLVVSDASRVRIRAARPAGKWGLGGVASRPKAGLRAPPRGGFAPPQRDRLGPRDEKGAHPERLLSLGTATSFLLALLAMHRRQLRADSPTVVFDLLAFDPNGTLSVLAETREPEGKIGSFDSHAGLKNATLPATRESGSCIESGTPCAGPEAQATAELRARNDEYVHDDSPKT